MMPIPAGLPQANGEFFVDQYQQPHLLIDNRVLDVEQFPAELKISVMEYGAARPEMITAYRLMGAETSEQLLKQILVCNWGGFDNIPDLVNGALQAPEFWDCPKRKLCKFSGIGCKALNTPDISRLSKREREIVTLIFQGHFDKTIASLLGISVTTVTTHNRNIRQKFGLSRKADIARFASQNNLIKS